MRKDGEFEYFGKLGRTYLKNSISFINSEKYLNLVDDKISCIVCTEELYPFFQKRNMGIIVSINPKSTFYKIYLTMFQKGYFDYFQNEISTESTISSRALIANRGVKIGKNCIIEDNVVIRAGTIIEDNVIVRNNSILGSEGFEVAEIDGINKIIPHSGCCFIKKNVEILNNTCVCKGLFQGYDTILEENVKIDNFVQIAHAVKIGKSTEIAAGTVISGNTSIGSHAWIGPNVTISNGLKIGNNVRINLGAVVINNLSDNLQVSGNFAYDHQKFLKNFARKQI